MVTEAQREVEAETCWAFTVFDPNCDVISRTPVSADCPEVILAEAIRKARNNLGYKIDKSVYQDVERFDFAVLRSANMQDYCSCYTLFELATWYGDMFCDCEDIILKSYMDAPRVRAGQMTYLIKDGEKVCPNARSYGSIMHYTISSDLHRNLWTTLFKWLLPTEAEVFVYRFGHLLPDDCLQILYARSGRMVEAEIYKSGDDTI